MKNRFLDTFLPSIVPVIVLLSNNGTLVGMSACRRMLPHATVAAQRAATRIPTRGLQTTRPVAALVEKSPLLEEIDKAITDPRLARKIESDAIKKKKFAEFLIDKSKKNPHDKALTQEAEIARGDAEIAVTKRDTMHLIQMVKKGRRDIENLSKATANIGKIQPKASWREWLTRKWQDLIGDKTTR